MASSSDSGPGAIRTGDGMVRLNERPNGERIDLVLLNAGDRPLQVGSHLHLPDANASLESDRVAARLPARHPVGHLGALRAGCIAACLAGATTSRAGAAQGSPAPICSSSTRPISPRTSASTSTSGRWSPTAPPRGAGDPSSACLAPTRRRSRLLSTGCAVSSSSAEADPSSRRTPARWRPTTTPRPSPLTTTTTSTSKWRSSRIRSPWWILAPIRLPHLPCAPVCREPHHRRRHPRRPR